MAYAARFMPVDRSIVKRGLTDALPLYVPAIPVALVIGLTVVETGMNQLVGWSSASIIFGGAAQLTVISLLGSGTAVVAVVTAGIVVNVRYLMYSAALAPKFQDQPRWLRWVGPYLLIDQLFALSTLRLEDDPKAFRTYYLTVGAFFWASWQLTVALGLLIGPAIPEEWNLEFAVAILFLGLVVTAVDKFPKAVAAMVGAGATYVFADLPNRSGLLVGALAGILAGTVVERMRS